MAGGAEQSRLEFYVGHKLLGCEGREEMTVEVLALAATVAFGLAGVAAAWYGYKSFKASKEQLTLARDQAAQVPWIELMEVALLSLEHDSELSRDVSEARAEMEELRRERAEEERQRRKRERAREELERLKREQRENREKWPDGFDASKVDETKAPNPADLMKSLANPIRMAALGNIVLPTPRPMLNPVNVKRVYEGPLPDHFVDVRIRNIGRAAAYDVTGWIWFERGVVEPVEEFGYADVEVGETERGWVKVQLSVGNEGGRLFPSRNDPYTFRIPVRLLKAADTHFEFEFTSPQGKPAHGKFALRLASGDGEEDDRR